jgi:serine/threonine-protein kinase
MAWDGAPAAALRRIAGRLRGGSAPPQQASNASKDKSKANPTRREAARIAVGAKEGGGGRRGQAGADGEAVGVIGVDGQTPGMPGLVARRRAQLLFRGVTAKMQLAANVVIAERFRLNRQLGQGGMGSVWHATHLALDIPCAVKFIEGEIAQLPEAQARFEREAKAAAQLRSPHVVQILDHGVWQGTPYIAMELLDGEDLGKRLTRIGRMAPNDVLRVVGQVTRALTKAHSVGIVHRDLKPDNIFLVPDDDREIAKVLDFGIAKATGSGIDGSNTKTGAMLGTPYYMSPEQAQGIKAVDARSDLWSLAVIVFQALTGRLPFESEALGDLLVRIIVAPVPGPGQFVSDLPATFDRWWEKASQRDPALRFQSARELGDALAVAFGNSQGLAGEAGMRPMALSDAGGTGNHPAQQPFGTTPRPGFGNTPNPALGNTPQPFGGTPGPYGATPQPRSYGGTQQLPGVGPTTGGSMSRTFDGPAAGVPAKGRGTLVAVAGAAAVVVVLGALGVTYAMKGKDAPPGAASNGPPGGGPPVEATTGVAAVQPPAPPPPTPPAPAPSAPVMAPTAETATAAAIAAAPAAAPKPAHASGWVAKPSPVPAPTPPPTVTKKAKVDLGI